MAFVMGSAERYQQYVDICDRAKQLGFAGGRSGRMGVLMDIESADRKFHMDLDAWLASDDYDFLHEFTGIQLNVNRADGFPATDFGLFVPRFATPA